ncbi:MAG TPA: helix-turn-helix transcriptional regulator [Ramlibacter sp.]|nr:helix-turn-helix transcriptional regulator [Ramlibacter sp.]
MNDVPDIPRVAQLLSDTARATILWTLIDGSTRAASELAFAANISAQSASRHLALLVNGGLLEAHARGRQRRFRIANSEAACLVESMAALSAGTEPRGRPEAAAVRPVPPEYRHARTCYDHLAGALAVELLDAMLRVGWLADEDREYTLTPRGERELAALNVGLAQARERRRVFARPCADVTQGRAHLGGALGAALLSACVANGWILRSRRSRIVSVTPQGHAIFAEIVQAQFRA